MTDNSHLSSSDNSDRMLLDVPPLAALQRVPLMGRVMQLFRHGGAAHERIGKMDEVVIDGEAVICRGACHDARIHITAMASVVADWSGRMKDMALPRLEFRDSADQVLFSIISLDGLEPFNTALDGLTPGAPVAATERPESDRSGVPDNDPGLLPLNAALATAKPVSIEMSGPGWNQSWSGVVESVKPGMGFINIMRPDFHLHLQARTISGWRVSGEGDAAIHEALNHDGAATGLRLLGDIGVIELPEPVNATSLEAAE